VLPVVLNVTWAVLGSDDVFSCTMMRIAVLPWGPVDGVMTTHDTSDDAAQVVVDVTVMGIVAG